MNSMKMSKGSAKYAPKCMCHMLGAGRRMELMPLSEKRKMLMEKQGAGWFDSLLDTATEGIIDLGSKALTKYGIPANLTKSALTGLKNIAIPKKGKGKKRVMSDKQKAYQQALKDIQKKHNISFKEALMKYKSMKK